MKSKNILVAVSFILFSCLGLSQSNEVVISYDDAGNRIKREVIVNPSLIIENNSSETTAMENIDNSGVSLDAHPNPTEGETDISVLLDHETISEEHQTAIESGVNMQLVDISGKVLQTQNGTSLDQTFDLRGLSNGIYFVKVFTEDGHLVGERKIVKE